MFIDFPNSLLKIDVIYEVFIVKSLNLLK